MKSYFWCADQYGWPLLGKAFSKLKAHRINIDCFLAFSDSRSEKPELLAYYDILRQVKISQCCCDILKKEPSEVMQAQLNVDVIFKGLMAAESRTRQTNFATRGYLFESHRDHLLKLDDGLTVEIRRVCTDGTRNACSILYGACTRIARDMGYKRVITYTLVSEPGTSLKASGFMNCGEAGGVSWDMPGRPREVEQVTLFGTERKYPEEKKTRWEKHFR